MSTSVKAGDHNNKAKIMDNTITYKQLKSARLWGIPLKLLLVPCAGATLLFDAGVILVSFSEPEHVVQLFLMALIISVPVAAFAWFVIRRDRRIIARIQNMTYAEFSQALREQRVVGEIHPRSLFDPFDRRFARCYILDDGGVVDVAGTLQPRRDRDNYRDFQHVEIYKL